MSRGGYREGAGRKSGWNYSDTQTIRVPVVFAKQLVELAKRLDDGESFDFVSNSDYRKHLRDISQEVLADPLVTRNGKDSGAVKRGLEAMINILCK